MDLLRYNTRTIEVFGHCNLIHSNLRFWMTAGWYFLAPKKIVILC